MNFSELAQKRYSCRKFSPRRAEAEKIEQIIGTALKAPTAVNRQPFKIFWMQSEAAKQKIHQVTQCTFGANDFLVLGCDENSAWVRPFDGQNFALTDGSIVGTHIMLEACELGLDTTWVGYFDAPKLKELCPAMKNYDLIAVFPVGYAAEDAEPSIRHFERKSKEEMVEIL